MVWLNTLLWVIRGGAAGLALFFALVLAVYTLVPLESTHAEATPASRVAQADNQ